MLTKFIDEPQNSVKELGVIDVMEVSFLNFVLSWKLVASGVSFVTWLCSSLYFLDQTIYEDYWLKNKNKRFWERILILFLCLYLSHVHI